MMAEAWNEIGGIVEPGLAAWMPGLVTFCIAIAGGAVFAAVWRWPLRTLRGWLFDLANAIDGIIVVRGSWLVGTRVRRRVPRWILLSMIFFALGTLGAFAPGNWGYGALLLGIVAILIVYRHWSWDEDDVASEVPEEEKRVAISGNLRNEVLTAVGFLFFYFPVAFARLQADGIAFSYLPGSGMVALTTFTLLEFLKAVPFVDYYEIFGSDLQFEKIANVAAPSLTAKFLTFALRASFDLVLVASLLRLPQIARLAQEGRDLRPIDEALASGDEPRQVEAVAAAHKFALRRRTRARDRLIQVTQEKLSSELFRYPLDVRIAAAEALTHAGRRLRDDAALYASAAAYRQVFKERKREDGPVAWARRQNDFGTVLCAIAQDRPDTAHLQEAIGAFNAAIDFYESTSLTEMRAGVQNNLGNALRAIAYRTREAADVKAAIAAYRAALEERTREAAPLDWAQTQSNLGIMLCEAGMAQGDAGGIEAGIACYRAALEERTRERDAPGWAASKNWLGNALNDLWILNGNDARAEDAIACFGEALQVRTAADAPDDRATTQISLGNTLSRLGRGRADGKMIGAAVAAYREALKQLRREQVPLDWAMVQHNLGNALSGLGELRGEARSLHDAIAAYGEALEERTRERVPFDWAMTQTSLGNALSRLGKLRSDRQALEKSIAAYRASLEVRTREARPLEWAASLNNMATALGSLARLRNEPALAEEAVALCGKALEVRTRGAMAFPWASTVATQAGLLADLGEMRNDPVLLEQAIEAFRAAIGVLHEQGAEGDAREAESEMRRSVDALATVRLTKAMG